MDPTIDFMHDTYCSLGFSLRRFKNKVCPAFATKELPREEAARIKRRKATSTSDPATSGRKARQFQLDTYKWHALGHLPEAIRAVGTYENPGTDFVSVVALCITIW